MPRRFEERVAAIEAALIDRDAPPSRALLRKVLGGVQGYLISLVAGSITDPDDPLVDPARQAFARLMDEPIKRDPQCHGKVAIAQALLNADVRADEVFEAGVGHVQLEPVLGGRQDTAAHLRGVSLIALVHAQHPRAFVHAARLLADPERAARLAAIRALAAAGRPDLAEPLLHLRLEIPDPDPEVLTECMTELARIDPRANLPVLASALNGVDPVASDAAALAIGASRIDGGLAVLVDAIDRTAASERRKIMLLGIAMLRSDAAWQHLIEVVMDAPPAVAMEAIGALATFKEQRGLRERVEGAAMESGAPEVRVHFEAVFGVT